MNVINNIKKAQQQTPSVGNSALVTRILNLFGSEPQIRRRNLFSIWGVIMFASSVFLMDKYGNQLAI